MGYRMKVEDLIKILQEVEDKTLQVRTNADHSQTPMLVYGGEVGYVDYLDACMPESIAPQDVGFGGEYVEGVNCFKVFEIWG
jgi:hypothetical protein